MFSPPSGAQQGSLRRSSTVVAQTKNGSSVRTEESPLFALEDAPRVTILFEVHVTAQRPMVLPAVLFRRRVAPESETGASPYPGYTGPQVDRRETPIGDKVVKSDATKSPAGRAIEWVAEGNLYRSRKARVAIAAILVLLALGLAVLLGRMTVPKVNLSSTAVTNEQLDAMWTQHSIRAAMQTAAALHAAPGSTDAERAYEMLQSAFKLQDTDRLIALINAASAEETANAGLTIVEAQRKSAAQAAMVASPELGDLPAQPRFSAQ